MGTEIELKFLAPASLRQVGAAGLRGVEVGRRTEKNLIATYFDTKKRKLRRCGLSLRVRKEEAKFVQTIKSTGTSQFGRGEWETEIDRDFPDLKGAKGTALEVLATRKLRRKLKPIFQTSVRRIAVPLRTSRSEIELAIDKGRVKAGRHSLPIEEVELELKRGEVGDLFRIARTLGKSVDAELSFQSKSERGYRLIRGEVAQPAGAAAIRLYRSMDALEAFRAIARSAVQHFAANIDAVRKRDAKGVHQMRIGLRRLRAAISLFSTVLSDKHRERIKRELKWIAKELAPAREIDVFINEQFRPALHSGLPREGVEAIERELAARRDEAFNRAEDAVNSARYRALLIDVVEWIETAGGRSMRRAEAPIRQTAKRIMRRQIKKARKQGRVLEDLTDVERHKLRIRIKKIRYASEFFETLFSKDKERKQLDQISKVLKALQDALGSLNDFLAQQERATQIALSAPKAHRPARAFVAGVLVGREKEASKRLLQKAIAEAGKLPAPRAML